VAAATAGLESVEHIPKGVMFTVLDASEMLPPGFPPIKTDGLAVALNGVEVEPNVHDSDEPEFTSTLISIPFSKNP